MIHIYLDTEQNKLKFNLIKKDFDTTQISFFSFNHNGRLNRTNTSFYFPKQVEHYLKYVIDNALYHSSEFFYLKNEEWWGRDNEYINGRIIIGKLFKIADKISRHLPVSIDELVYYNRIAGKFTKITGVNNTKTLIEQIILLETLDK